MTICKHCRRALAGLLLVGAAAGHAGIVPKATPTGPVTVATAPLAIDGALARRVAAFRASPGQARHGAAPRTVDVAAVATDGTITIARGRGTLVRLTRAAATVFIADPDVADFQTRSPELVYLFGKSVGETTIFAVDAGGSVILARTVAVTPNLDALRAALARHLPNDAIAVDALVGSITLSGSVLSAGHAADALAIAAPFVDAKRGETVVNLMAVAAPSQVNLRVRIAEVDRNVLKQIGINWDAVASSGRFAFGLVTQNPVMFADVLNRNTLALHYDNVSSMIDALAQEGYITLLAQPNLTALSGETASFLAGGEFPVPVAATPGTGAPTVTIAFKKFGVSLDFIPTVLDGNRINLKVRPEVSQLSTSSGVQLQGFSVPGLTVRRAETTVELGSGETFVIAGLLQRSSENNLSKVPGLGDVPVIGALLRSSRYRRNETELAIIVTPYLVKPVGDPTRVATPVDGLIDATDSQRVLHGEFFQQHSAVRAPTKAPQP